MSKEELSSRKEKHIFRSKLIREIKRANSCVDETFPCFPAFIMFKNKRERSKSINPFGFNPLDEEGGAKKKKRNKRGKRKNFDAEKAELFPEYAEQDETRGNNANVTCALRLDLPLVGNCSRFLSLLHAQVLLAVTSGCTRVTRTSSTSSSSAPSSASSSPSC